MASILVTPPTEEPVTLEMVKAQSRITHTLDDALLLVYIASARDYLEIVTRRQFLAATYQWTGFQQPPGTLVLDRSPLQSVSEIAVMSGMSVESILDPTTYMILPGTDPAAIALLTPVAATALLRVTFVAGWSMPEVMPPSLVQAMLLLVAHWYEHREASTMERNVEKLPYALESLIWANKLVTA
jgi:uncharacterized phiE125 gp8 family phage protein